MAHQSPPAIDNLTRETETAAPDSVDVAQAVELMGDLADEDEPEAAAVAPADEGEADEAAADAADGDEESAAAEEAADEEAAEGAPEFWSAKDKAAWNSVPAELRPVLKKYEQQRVEFVNEKAREAAAVRAQAHEQVQRANATVDQAAQWWQQAGPALQQAFADKWSG